LSRALRASSFALATLSIFFSSFAESFSYRLAFAPPPTAPDLACFSLSLTPPILGFFGSLSPAGLSFFGLDESSPFLLKLLFFCFLCV